MNGVREIAITLSWLFVGAALSGCAAQSLRTADTAPGVFASVDAGVAKIDVDTIDGTLEVDDDTSALIQLGLGYQVNNNVAVEFRAGDLGSVEFTDGRELTYQFADISGLLMWRQRNTSVFGRIGVGTFINDGDFDVELETPVHAVIGGGVAYHVLPNLDIRFSVNSQGGDAVTGSAGLVWRFGARSSIASQVTTVPVRSEVEDDGFVPIAPLVREEVSAQPDATSIASGEEPTNSLLIDEKPSSRLLTFPEPVVPSSVTDSITAESEAERARLAALAPLPAPSSEPETVQEFAPAPEVTAGLESEKELVPAPEVDAVSIIEQPTEKLFVVDTLLEVSPLQFASGAATMLESSALDLSEVSDILKTNPTLRLQVESHVAPVGNAELNMLLSRRRALTVIRLLVDQGIDAVRLRPRAFGDTAPIADAGSIDDNDRVEFRIR